MSFSIDNNELDALQYACEYMKLRYYSMPVNAGLSTVFVKHRDGSELSNQDGYYLGRMILQKFEIDNGMNVVDRLRLPVGSTVLVYPNEEFSELPR